MVLQKTLVVGSSHHAHVTCIAWDALRSVNLKDFDVVVFNVLSLDDPTIRRLPRRGFFDQVRTQLSMLLASGGKIVVLTPEVRYIKQGDENRTTWEWCPIVIGTHCESGDTIEIKTNDFEKYLSRLKCWSFFFFVPTHPLTHELTQIFGWPNAVGYEFPMEAFAVNRYGKTLAGEVTLLVSDGGNNNMFGSITLLPFIEELEQKEAIGLILEDLLGEPQQSLPPDWVGQIPMPFVEMINAEIATKQAEIQRLSLEILAAESNRSGIEKWKKLVYATGLELEEIVEQAFIELGATTRPPVTEEEFILEHNGILGIVECKGVGKSISLDHLRQTDSHVLGFIQLEEREARGILFGNAWRSLPLEQRGNSDAPIFPPNVVSHACRRGIALISSKDFLDVFCRFLNGQVSGGAILDAINTQSGVVDFQEIG